MRETTYGVFQSVPAGVPFDYHGRFFYLAGLAVERPKSVREPFRSMTLRSGRHAVFRFTRAYSEIFDAFGTLPLHRPPESEWQLDEREVFERYPGYKVGCDTLPVFEVWLPVVPKA